MALFYHECSRVIADRFTNLTDKDWFEMTFQKVCGMAAILDQTMPCMSKHVFCTDDFMWKCFLLMTF